VIEGVDIVITWVDNKDPQWLSDYEMYLDKDDLKEINGRVRFEDLGALHYILRGIEKFMPWHRKIHLVTSGHTPSWLNLEHPKLQVVCHKQIFPNVEDLPTFNCCAIEMCFSNIPDLAEKFIYFNDDMFIVKSLEKTDFFDKGMPKDFLLLDILFHDGVFSHMLHSDMQILNKEITNHREFRKRNFFKIINYKYGFSRNIKNLFLLFFKRISLIQIHHHPQPMKKSIIEEVVLKYPLDVQKTRSCKFKRPSNLNQYIFRFINLIKGNFIPYFPNNALYIGVEDIDDLAKEIDKLKNNSQVSLVCFNEEAGFNMEDYGAYKLLIQRYLDALLPIKSSYEI
tara:strand:- start:11065 stop:12081 length:1017 start_codon:yes stop_codon:yes gene_type:complete